MKCNFRVRGLPDKCPLCNRKMKEMQCKCGFKVSQPRSNWERKLEKMIFGFYW